MDNNQNTAVATGANATVQPQAQNQNVASNTIVLLVSYANLGKVKF